MTGWNACDGVLVTRRLERERAETRARRLAESGLWDTEAVRSSGSARRERGWRRWFAIGRLASLRARAEG